VPGADGGTTPVEAMLVREPRTVVSPMSIETPPLLPVQTPTDVEVRLPEAASAAIAEARPRDHDRTPRVQRVSEPTLVPPVPVPPPPAAREMGVGSKIVMATVTLGVVGTLVFLLSDRSPDHPLATARVTPAEARPRVEPPAPPAEVPPPRVAAVVPAPPPPAPPIEKAAPASEEIEPGTMAIPLVGSTKGMQFYKLAEPPGLVINLPHGYPRPGARVPGSPFKRLAVQRKGPGSQLRLYFTLDQNAEVTAEGGGLRVVLRAGKRARKT
jgi:hypothetical protein